MVVLRNDKDELIYTVLLFCYTRNDINTDPQHLDKYIR